MDTAPAPLLASVDLDADGLSLAYMEFPQDVRKNGLTWQHRVFVPRGSDYDDEIDAAVEALQALLTDVLDDIDRAEPVELAEDEDEEAEEDE